MAKGKEKSVFFCQECGYESAKWLGKCPGCGQWNTFVEETVSKQKHEAVRLLPSSEPVGLQEIAYDDLLRIDTGIHELNRVLGGGMVPGALMLLAGDPGIGKSTLTMQLTETIRLDGKILYVSGEESRQQLKMRAQRLHVKTGQLLILTENNLAIIEKQIEKIQPKLLILDSISDRVFAGGILCAGQCQPIAGVYRADYAVGQGLGNFHCSGRPCHQGRICGRSAGAGTYGGYGVVF